MLSPFYFASIEKVFSSHYEHQSDILYCATKTFLSLIWMKIFFISILLYISEKGFMLRNRSPEQTTRAWTFQMTQLIFLLFLQFILYSAWIVGWSPSPSESLSKMKNFREWRILELLKHFYKQSKAWEKFVANVIFLQEVEIQNPDPA